MTRTFGKAYYGKDSGHVKGLPEVFIGLGKSS